MRHFLAVRAVSTWTVTGCHGPSHPSQRRDGCPANHQPNVTGVTGVTGCDSHNAIQGFCKFAYLVYNVTVVIGRWQKTLAQAGMSFDAGKLADNYFF